MSGRHGERRTLVPPGLRVPFRLGMHYLPWKPYTMRRCSLPAANGVVNKERCLTLKQRFLQKNTPAAANADCAPKLRPAPNTAPCGSIIFYPLSPLFTQNSCSLSRQFFRCQSARQRVYAAAQFSAVLNFPSFFYTICKNVSECAHSGELLWKN